MEYQKIFIQIITRYLPEGYKLVDFISELIHIGKEASYRRIRCEVEFSISEVVTIAKKLNINLSSLVISEGGDKTVFNLRFLEDSDFALRYTKRLKGDIHLLEGFSGEDCFINKVLCTIPDELIYFFPHLTKFQLLKIQFSNSKSSPLTLEAIRVPKTIEDTVDELHQKLRANHLTYIFEPNLFLPIVDDISFFYRLNLISEEEKNSLKKELLEALDIINTTATLGEYKGKEVCIYVSHVSFNMSHAFYKNKDLEASVIELSPPNSLLSFDKQICAYHEMRIKQIKKYSSLVSLSGEINKMSFITKQKGYINYL